MPQLREAVPPRPRSQFVSGLAWLMLIFGVIGVVSGLMDFTTTTPMLLDSDVSELLPSGTMRALDILTFAMSVIQVWVSVALLLRKEWARQLFVAGFLLTAIVLALCVVLAIVSMLLGGFDHALLATGLASPEVMGLMKSVITFMLVLVALAAALNWWLARKLQTPAIRAEFATPS